MREREYHFHDGGKNQQEALATYEHGINLALAKRAKLIAEGEPTNVSLSGTTSVRDEIMLDYSVKSVDGLLCSLYTNKGKVYFLASMFEKAEEHYSKALEIEPLYLDAVGARGSCRIILGKFPEAGQDLLTVIELDENRFFMDAFTGIARVLAAKESAVPQGWEPVITKVHELIPIFTSRYEALDDHSGKNMLGGALDRLHHVLYTYHDIKTMNTKLAWEHLTTGYKYKLAALPKWSGAFEREKLMTAKQVFHKGFWSESVGSELVFPVFIIGFVRSGSTLLERVLDAHPRMVGLGEDSVFNGQLGYIRDTIVDASVNKMTEMPSVVDDLAHEVVAEMKKRWKIIEANTKKDDNETLADSLEPLRGVDKMLTNYMNVGFIHMLFPKALILHVAREPMDSVFSAFKHEFPPGTLEYTADFQAVSDLYLVYREVMEHWDEVLPGRIIHIRYEDMVRDMPGMAKAIIKTTGLKWDEGVLEFHKKKQAVNTYSSTQVREGVYTKSIESWRRYEEQLQPLVKLLGKRATYNLKTTLPHYKRPRQGEL
jgi:tetratricopeptide (TPR) repeat protein